jgi:hypothetical protein
MFSLVSMPVVDMSLLPLSLAVPNGINNGGYKLPQAGDAYSSIDVLVAGIEALRRDIIVTSLVSFFDQNRTGCSSESEVFLTFINDTKGIATYPISWVKHESKFDSDLYKIMSRNAPLTFKWV